ncbi:hypothetical protein HHL09_26335 [Luteolibacter luteus]|uniref:Uncharacterized protein n=2 Tax=Luteolibacter luteus TaxID=2728835 RepID=A0A858RSH3_9BACT|nr:hypothetical protein [Luteolibacter luteus]QJE99150.1 hypothetical protein HHL09_26335 [Luteolibacter luteus]
MSEPTEADLERLRSLLEAIVQAWEPDEAVVASSDTSSEGGEAAPIHEKGWFSYSKSGGLIKN